MGVWSSGHRVLVQNGEKVLEMERGGGRTTL